MPAHRAAVFIAEITARAFIIADSNKRRTLSRADIAKALTKSDQFDFLIDIVPREEPFAGAGGAGPSGGNGAKRQPLPSAAKREPVSRYQPSWRLWAWAISNPVVWAKAGPSLSRSGGCSSTNNPRRYRHPRNWNQNHKRARAATRRRTRRGAQRCWTRCAVLFN
jgi:hypothetical protein